MSSPPSSTDDWKTIPPLLFTSPTSRNVTSPTQPTDTIGATPPGSSSSSVRGAATPSETLRSVLFKRVRVRSASIKAVNVAELVGDSAWEIPNLCEPHVQEPDPSQQQLDALAQLEHFADEKVCEGIVKHNLFAMWVEDPFAAVQQHVRQRAGLELVADENVRLVELPSVGDAGTDISVRLFSAKIRTSDQRVEGIGTRDAMALRVAAAKALTSSSW